MLEKNQVHTAEITGLTSEGSGVCRIDGMAVFVPMTAVGDRLLVKIVRCALSTKRTKPVLQKPENERYFMHSWLIRLGCGGPDSKALRRLMIENLDGYCAFPDEARAQKHRDKYKEIRRIRREINEEADRR